MRADAESEAAVLDVLDRFCSAFAERAADEVLGLFAPDPDIVMVTSEAALLRGPNEVSAFLRRYAGSTDRYPATAAARSTKSARTALNSGWR